MTADELHHVVAGSGPPLLLLDAGHFLPEERPDEVAAAIRELLSAP